ncbi:DUF58 domain-containing protein [Shewanella sp. A3A]|uniref:DUF58 domain-containing protein n=1 Tax=Shewanella electrica TaxID=515560 RepID=A0ABT2FI23_9GAMM|nr:DUF58 domain-containing protein [Shewanella electrica]MCH1917978.1 DUF58 domain-containing protein [Shewanella ferrihydritica]MCH1925075.1 DUF58 domain-containing protein [Shewanella electrica]MCS4554899.1 DUF58 domain-containing protein [Shewanella electrica]
MATNSQQIMDPNLLFDPELLSRIEHLALMVSNVQSGGRLAEQRTRARGQGMEFADFKPYVAGDDLRAIDWNSYRRLGKVFVRLFEEQQAMPVYFLVDLSASMFNETPSPRIHAALRSVMALAAIVLAQYDSVSVFALGKQAAQIQKSLTGRGSLPRMAQQLSAVQSIDDANLASALQQFAGMPMRRGLVVVLSDFFSPEGLPAISDALDTLPHAKLLVQLTQPWDQQPQLHPQVNSSGADVRFQDCETLSVTDVVLSPKVLKAYQEVYQAFNDELTHYAQSRQAGLIPLDCQSDIVEQLSDWFAQGVNL